MQFVDLALIHIAAGKGGDGVISFRREKYVPKGGPDGGNGGKGGAVIFLADPQLSTLLDFRYKKQYQAANGKAGDKNNMTGRNGADTIIKVPVGTVVKDATTEKLLADLATPYEQIVVAKGGKGGLGNAEFKTSTNQAPRHKTSGKPGEEFELQLELKLLADVALVGFPNAGKSTLISRISAAKPKIADYPFTTLIPNLGIVQAPEEHRSFVVADIPGLIEGASKGKGLGHQFLRHIERSQVMLFLLDINDPTNAPEDAYRILKAELKAHDPSLAKKTKVVALTKADTVTVSEIKALQKLRFDRKAALVISAVSGYNIDKLIDTLWKTIGESSEKLGD